MFRTSQPHHPAINRNTLVATIPIFFLSLLALWTVLNASVSAIKADPSPTSAIAIVKRPSANLREGPGTQYRILGRSLRGASLPITGKYDDGSGQRWYKCYLRAFGDVWVSGTVVLINPTNANIPTVSVTTSNVIGNQISLATMIPTNVLPSGNAPSSPSPASHPSNPGPVTTPEVTG